MLAQLESKVLDLQSQIQATQAQITDYQTNSAYVDFYYVCPICRKNNAKNNKCSTLDIKHRYRNTLKATYFFYKNRRTSTSPNATSHITKRAKSYSSTIQASKITNTKHAQNLANTITQNRASQNLANSKAITLSQKSIQKLATNPHAKAILEKIHIKNDIIPALEKGEQVKEADIIKALESSPQKGQEMLIIGKQNLSEGVLEWAKNNNKKIAVDILPEQKAKELGFRYLKVKRTISASEINHTLRRHGKNSPLIKKRMQEPITLEKIKKWTQYADEADYQTISTDNLGVEVLLSGKQINGYYVIIESIRKGANELAFKTMYFEKGNILKHKNFKQFDKNGFGATNGKTAPSHQVTSPPLN